MIAKGIAIPHVRLNTIDDLMIGIATSKSGIIFTDKEPPVHIIILLLTPKEKPSLHLQVLSSLSKIILKDNIIDSIIAMNDSEDIWKFFNRENLNFPDYICAGDIMSPDPISLSEFQNLAEAIDLIVRKNISDVPVIDKEGDLVGVVTAYELLKVCLPDYILWIDDLSPIINFEPFTHILQNESNTWLAEIMSFDYAVVDEKDPAITVAKEITKHKSNQAYVLRDKKLVGVISIERFVNKIFRE